MAGGTPDILKLTLVYRSEKACYKIALVSIYIKQFGLTT
jgi:hypothetical protein